MHYRNFTAHDTLLLFGIGLLVFIGLQFLLARSGKPAWEWNWVAYALLFGIMTTLLSTFVYSEAIPANGITERGALLRAGYPRWIYETGNETGDSLFGPDFRFQAQYFLENTALYTILLLVVRSLVTYFR